MRSDWQSWTCRTRVQLQGQVLRTVVCSFPLLSSGTAGNPTIIAGGPSPSTKADPCPESSGRPAAASAQTSRKLGRRDNIQEDFKHVGVTLGTTGQGLILIAGHGGTLGKHIVIIVPTWPTWLIGSSRQGRLECSAFLGRWAFD